VFGRPRNVRTGGDRRHRRTAGGWCSVVSSMEVIMERTLLAVTVIMLGVTLGLFGFADPSGFDNLAWTLAGS